MSYFDTDVVRNSLWNILVCFFELEHRVFHSVTVLCHWNFFVIDIVIRMYWRVVLGGGGVVVVDVVKVYRSAAAEEPFMLEVCVKLSNMLLNLCRSISWGQCDWFAI